MSALQVTQHLNTVEHAGVSTEQVSVAIAYPRDFERVYPLLQQFNIDSIDKSKWQLLFDNWNSPDDPCGYVLLDGNEVKGFLGLLFSERIVNGRLEKFCNMTSWIVADSYRAHSLKLLQAALGSKDCTITNFTPSKTVAAILERFGFLEIPTEHYLLFPRPAIAFFPSAYRCTFDVDEMRELFSEGDRRILEDHLRFDCTSLAIVPKVIDGARNADYCYLVVKRKNYRHLPAVRIHYVSNRKFFSKSIDTARTELCWRLKVGGLMCDKRYLDGSELSYMRSIGCECPAFLKSSTVKAAQIDTLYSEMILLHS